MNVNTSLLKLNQVDFKPLSIVTNFCPILPQILVPQESIDLAECFGIDQALQSFLSKDPSFEASAALTLMESLYKNNYREKVWLFANTTGRWLGSRLENISQKVEFFIRIAKLMPKEQRMIWRDEAF